MLISVSSRGLQQTTMEPSKEAISVRLARLYNQILDKSAAASGPANVLKKPLNTENLLDALVVLYDECNSDTLKRSDEHIAKFVEKYRVVLSEIKRLRVNISDFEVKDIIGRGHFGEVHVVREKHTGDVFAMKTLRKDATLKHKDNMFYEEEKDIMVLSKSEWLIKLHYAFQDSAQLYLVMDFCPGGDLAGLLDRRGQPLMESEACFYTAELCQALNALHAMGYVHRDVKPDNVLLDRCGHLKLADFGSAAKISSTGKATAVMPVGTPDYIAPELLKAMESSKFANHGTPCDFWSLGVVAYELVTLKTPYSDQSDRITHTYGNIMKADTITYPAEVERAISSDFKELIRCLLNPLPELRYGYLDIVRHAALKNVHWTTLRNEVPPFVPIVSGLDDTSNFVEFEKHLPIPSLENFLNRNHFSGRNLPFIGFTYTEEADPLPKYDICCNNGASVDSSFHTADDLNSSVGSHDRSTVNGFLNSSYNSTAINMKSVKELERALEGRTREMISLKKRFSEMQSRAKAAEELADSLPTLEHDLAHASAAVSRLTRQIDLEHKERADLETKSLELISLAKKKWEAKSLAQTEQLNKTIVNYEFKTKELECEKEMLMNRINTLSSDLKQANNEVASMKKLQINYKEVLRKVHELQHRRYSEVNVKPIESMAKVRLVSRQSMVANETRDAARISSAAQETAVADERANRLALDLRTADDRIKSLLVELTEFKKDYADLLRVRAEATTMRDKIKELEEDKERLEEEFEQYEMNTSTKLSTLNHNILAEKEQSTKLKNQIRKLQSELNDLKRNQDTRKSAENEKTEQSARTIARFEETLHSMEHKNNMLQKKLDRTLESEERHKDKVTEMENLVQRLEQDVSRLESCTPAFSNNKDIANAAKVSLLEEQLTKVEEQLARVREQAVLTKDESKRSNMALWKKEKELSDSDLHKRIAEREVKQLEAKVKSLTEELKVANEEKQKLEESIQGKDKTLEALKRELESSNETLDRAEESVRNMHNSCDRKEEALLKTKEDIARLKNDCLFLRTEMQRNESRRTKAEVTVEELRSQLKSSESARSSSREEIVRLTLTLEEKTRDFDTLQTNHKMLQETCALLEDQLMDFEKLSEVQEKRHNELKVELAESRASADTAMARVSEAEKNAAQMKAERDSLYVKLQRARSDIDHHSLRANQLEKDLSGMQAIASEAESRVAMLEDNSSTMAADNVRRLTALREELRSVKEECAITATNLYASRDHSAALEENIRELREEVATSRRVAASAEAESTARTEHFRQRELRAQDTIKQHTKLIDFLQAKVEDSSRRKRSGLSNLFRSGRDAPFPGSPTPVANVTNIERSLHRERQQNRELREQLSLLKHKLSVLEGGNIVMEDKKKTDEKVKTDETVVLSGWIRIVKPEGTERCFMTLAGNQLKLHSDVPMSASSQLLAQIQLSPKEPTVEESRATTRQQIRLTTKLTTENVPTLGETERSFAFMLECPSSTASTWSSRKMVIVCPSNAIREKWLKALAKFSIVEVADSPHNLNLPQNNSYIPRKVIALQRRSVSPRCLVEISQGVYLLGAEQGLFSYHTPVTTLEDSKRAFNGPDEPVKISGLDNIFSMKAIHQANMLICLCGVSNVTNGNSSVNASRAASGDLWWSDLRFTTSVAHRPATLQPSIEPHRVVLPNNERCTRIDVLIGAECTVCACVEKAIIILVKETSGEGGLVPRRRIETKAFINAARLVDHTLLFATGFMVYRLDLKKSQVDTFLDQKLTEIYNQRDVIEIILIKKQKAEHSPEYLICYKECGVFVDQDGRKSRSEDLKWSRIPIQIVYRQPFLYVFYEKSLHVLGIDDRMCQLPSCECNCDSTSVSTVSLAHEKVVIDITTPKYLGKSLNVGGIIISSTEGPSVAVLEVIGAECYRKGLGISMETLDSVDSVDSVDEDDPIVRNWRSIDEVDGDAISQASLASQSSESSAEVTHFSSVIKKRAKMLKNKRNAQEPAKPNTDTSSSSGSENKTSAELCAEIFAAERKHVRFNGKH